MNRGAGYQDIYSSDDHRRMFLDLLRELHETFQVNIHAYCLMGNHYHLLLETPLGNLSRAMRHLNGVYTQRYNREVKSDGPLFRGRYKAILVDVDEYLLNVSRYIHRNPIEADIVRKAEKYRWSSYRAYIGQIHSPSWLTTQQTLSMIGVRNQALRYKAFVEAGLDEEIEQFYGKKKQAPILGTKSFIERISQGIQPNREHTDTPQKAKEIDIAVVIQVVTEVFNVTEAVLFNVPRGRGQDNPARSAALYLARKTAGKPLSEIAEAFGLSHYGSASGMISRFAKRIKQDKSLDKMVKEVEKTIKVLD
jgi:REP element-mobilizing transposase RayT